MRWQAALACVAVSAVNAQPLKQNGWLGPARILAEHHHLSQLSQPTGRVLQVIPQDLLMLPIQEAAHGLLQAFAPKERRDVPRPDLAGAADIEGDRDRREPASPQLENRKVAALRAPAEAGALLQVVSAIVQAGLKPARLARSASRVPAAVRSSSGGRATRLRRAAQVP